MKKSNHEALRALLRAHPGGMSTHALMRLTGKGESSIRRSLGTMPDAYISRWSGPVRGQFVAIWCVVVPPPNCQHPRDREEGPQVMMPPQPVQQVRTRWVGASPWSGL